MQVHPAPDRPAADPAAPLRIPAEAGDPPAAAAGAVRQPRWSLEERLEQAERRGEVIRARAVWIDERRRDLMERRARLQERLDSAEAPRLSGVARPHEPPCPAGADASSPTPPIQESAPPPVPRAVPSSYVESIQELTSAVERALEVRGGGRAPVLDVTARAGARH